MKIIHLNSKQKKSLDKIDENPALGNMKWADVEALLLALIDNIGGDLSHKKGSAVVVNLPGAKPSVLHMPHGGGSGECDKYTIRAVRKLLRQVGVLDDFYSIE